jgi:5-hydroxyisourate hydrolase
VTGEILSLSTHVLDTSRGRPAAGMPVRLDRYGGGTWQPVAEDFTDDDGRLKDLPATEEGTYRLRFGTGQYFAAYQAETFYPEVSVVFVITDQGEHYHVPLLVSPYGYSTYRGS